MTVSHHALTLVKKGATELHKPLSRCKDRPALVLELVEPVVGGRTVDTSTIAKPPMSVEVGVVTELEIERDVTGSVDPEMESDDADDDEVPGPVEEVMAKAGLLSPKSPNTGIQTRIL
jgi:hypothetical protein